MPTPSNLTNIRDIERDARKHTELGAVTADYSADREEVIKQLNQALATELVCVLRYRRHHFMARGIHSRSVAAEFLAHANEELGHADVLAMRIVQLGGSPDFSPVGLTERSHAQYVAGTNLSSMILEDLVAERVAISSYKTMIRYLGNDDPTTSEILKKILAVEEEHADDLAGLMDNLPESE